MDRLTYLTLGAEPAPGPVLQFPRAPARIASIYRARIAAVRAARGDFVCWADGGGDAFAEDWPEICAEIIERMDAEGASIGYCDETRSGVPVASGPWSMVAAMSHPQMIHHAAVCRVSALHALPWPAGCINWETYAYHALAAQGWVYVPRIGYHWTPTPGGAHSWADTQRGIQNALVHLQGRTGTHFAHDHQD
jgi:hypothetical protein